MCQELSRVKRANDHRDTIIKSLSLSRDPSSHLEFNSEDGRGTVTRLCGVRGQDDVNIF